MYGTNALHSTFKNTSGATMYFAFLPPHGMELDDGESVTIFGDLREAVNRGDRFGRRMMDSLQAVLDAGTAELVDTAAPILYDPILRNTKMVSLDNGTLVLEDPVFEASVSA